MEDSSQSRPLLIAAGIALAALVVLSLAGVDLYRCTIVDDVESERSRTGGPEGAALERNLRLWLDAGDLDDALARALAAHLARLPATPVLRQEPTGGGQVTVRVDDASLYTPLYARAKLSAGMRVEAKGEGGAALPVVHGDTRVALEGACYGVIAPSRFRDVVADSLARPLAEALAVAFE